MRVQRLHPGERLAGMIGRPLIRASAALALLAAILVGAVVATRWSPTPEGAGQAPSATPGPSQATAGQPEEQPGPEAWTTVDWLPPLQNPLGPPDPLRRIDGLIATDGGYLGWGRAPLRAQNQFNDMGAIFLTADGGAWQTVPVQHGVEPANASTVLAVAEGPGGFLAIGSVCCEPERSAAWRSEDGVAWTLLAIGGDLDPAGTWLTAVVALADRWLVLGADRDGTRSMVWSSVDGSAWETGLEVDNGRPGLGLRDLAHTSEGAVAVGVVLAGDGSYDGGVWSSADGRTWERLAADDPAMTDAEVQPWSVTGHASGLFMSGVLGTEDERRRCEGASALLASVSPLPPREPVADATSCVSGQEATWRSADGEAWELIVPRGQLQPIEFRVMAAGGAGLLLLGESSGPASPDTALFASADGAVWQPLTDDPRLHRDVAVAMAVRGTEILAVTERWDGTSSVLHAWRGTAR